MYLLSHSSGNLDCAHAVVICDYFNLMWAMWLGWCINRGGSSAQHLKKANFSLAHSQVSLGGQHTPACGRIAVVGFVT